MFENGASRPLTHLFVKIFKAKSQESDLERMRQRVVKDFENTSKIHQAMSASTDFGAVRPIACYPEHLAAVTEEASGQTLLEYLHSNAAWVPRAERTERLSRTMEKSGPVGVCVSSDRSAAGQRSRSRLFDRTSTSRLRVLVATPAAAFGERDRARVLKHIERLYAEVPADDLIETDPCRPCPGKHALSGERVVVLDFAMCGRGSVFHDLSRLFLQLDLLRFKPQFSGDAIDA